MSLQRTFIKSRNSYKVTFELGMASNPQQLEVRLLGDFNNWSYSEAPVLKYKNGSYVTKVELPEAREFQYRYMIGEHDWANDAYADAYVPSPHAYVDNCVVKLDSQSKPTAKKVKTTGFSFTKIEGVGPKISSLLVEAGIASYAELAAMKEEDISSILALAGKRYTMHNPATWPKQAKLLAQGKISALKTLQTKLKGGKKK